MVGKGLEWLYFHQQSGEDANTTASLLETEADILGTRLLATAGYTAVGTLIILWVTNMLVGNRVADDEEVEGLDLVLHNERGYDL